MANMNLLPDRRMIPRMKAPLSGAAGTNGALQLDTIVLSALAATLPGVAAGLRVNHELWAGALYNPDSAMRLVRLNDIVAAGEPLHAVMRDASGAGNVLPWSHLLDSLLLLLAAPLASVIGWHDALHIAGLAFGPLCMAALGIAVAWAVAPLVPSRFLWIAAAATGSAPMVQGYGLLGVVHHHVLVTLAPVMAAGWAIRMLRAQSNEHRSPQCGIALGAWAATGIWLSPEALPFVLMAMGVLWASWFGPAHSATTPTKSRPVIAGGLLAAHATMALLLTLAWLVDPPAPGLLSVEPDRLSLPFVLLAVGAAVTAIVARQATRRIPTLLCGTALAVAWLAGFPQFLHGTSGLMTPEQAHAFFDNIGEMEPVRGIDGAIEALLGGAFATLALSFFAWRALTGRDTQADCLPLGFAIACAVALLALASLHIRFAAYPSVAGAAMLPIVLAAISRAGWSPVHRSLARAAIVLLLITAPLMAPLAATAGPSAGLGRQCSLAGAITLLAKHPGEIVLSNVNTTPDLLYRTPVRTVGSLYHRNPEAYMRLRAAWLEAVADTPGPALLATGATLVLGCPGETRSALAASLAPSLAKDAAPATLLDRLSANAPPAWLRRLGDGGADGPVLYQVVK